MATIAMAATKIRLFIGLAVISTLMGGGTYLSHS
jgi:hypothetical protein